MRATTEREAFLREKVMSRIGLDSIRRFTSLSSRDLLARFLLRVFGRQSCAKRKVGTVVRSCRYDLASDPPGTLTGTMSGTQFWCDHGQTVPSHDFSG
jgi:hypothetical protein